MPLSIFFTFFSSAKTSVLRVATDESRMSPESHRSRAKDQKRLLQDEQDWSPQGGPCDRMVVEVLNPWKQALESRHAVQQSEPASLAAGFPYFCPYGLCGCASHGFTWTSASSLLGFSLCIHFFLSWYGGFQDSAKAKSACKALVLEGLYALNRTHSQVSGIVRLRVSLLD